MICPRESCFDSDPSSSNRSGTRALNVRSFVLSSSSRSDPRGVFLRKPAHTGSKLPSWCVDQAKQPRGQIKLSIRPVVPGKETASVHWGVSGESSALAPFNSLGEKVSPLGRRVCWSVQRMERCCPTWIDKHGGVERIKQEKFVTKPTRLRVF